ncbi:hypothetical protein Y032_0046g1349 [Ancylostoma ceylanicum]|uniref:Uncharacterized protein n=1 Tax=Ancylostoma ceylanicum TaxID=53326 RepID=A0A016UCT8_9BILA|nr:hypothetical protein Y032_0046g1349 [Ancylostoma ceylanicum]
MYRSAKSYAELTLTHIHSATLLCTSPTTSTNPSWFVSIWKDNTRSEKPLGTSTDDAGECDRRAHVDDHRVTHEIVALVVRALLGGHLNERRMSPTGGPS